MKIQLEGIPQTLLFPLWGRAKISREYKDILYDPKAIELTESMQYDFGKTDRITSPFSNALLSVRARMLDEEIKIFISAHPRADIVNLGAGLDTTFFRVDNGLIHWYDIDLPDVIELRHQLLPSNCRSRNLGRSRFDLEWCKAIHQTGNGLFFISGGVFIYFHETRIKNLLAGLANAFPGSEMVFETASTLGKYYSNRIVKTGVKSARLEWSVTDPRRIQSWEKRFIHLESYPLFSRINKNIFRNKQIQIMMVISDILHMACIVHIYF